MIPWMPHRPCSSLSIYYLVHGLGIGRKERHTSLSNVRYAQAIGTNSSVIMVRFVSVDMYVGYRIIVKDDGRNKRGRAVATRSFRLC